MRRLFSLLLPLLVSPVLAAQPSINAPGIITHGPRNTQQVALTFDADMTPGMLARLKSGAVKSNDNEKVVQVLKKTGTPATFFLTGMWAQVYPQSARAMAQNPLFEVENHSYDHPGFSQPCYGLAVVAQATKLGNMQRASQAIAKVTGVTPRYFRFPGGCAERGDVLLARQAGMQVVHWDVVGGDVNQPDPQAIVRQTLAGVRGGSIIVLHVSGGHAPATAEALPGIIAGLKQKGLTPVTLQTLLGGQMSPKKQP